MGLYAEYLKDWILMDPDCNPRKLPPAAVWDTCSRALDDGRITAEEFRQLVEIGDADRLVNTSGGAT